MDLDRKDLAIDLRVRLGDWFRVIQLLKSSGATGSADDAILDKIRMNIGDYYYDRQRWYAIFMSLTKSIFISLTNSKGLKRLATMHKARTCSNWRNATTT